jgi:hypothetical protein
MEASDKVSREYSIQGLARELMLAAVSSGAVPIDSEAFFTLAEDFTNRGDERLLPLEEELAAEVVTRVTDRAPFAASEPMTEGRPLEGR